MTWRQKEVAGQSCRNVLTAVLTFTVRGKSTKRYKGERTNSSLKKYNLGYVSLPNSVLAFDGVTQTRPLVWVTF